MPKTVALCPVHALGCTSKIAAFTASPIGINSPTYTTRTLGHGAFAKIQYVTIATSNVCLTYLYCIGFRPQYINLKCDLCILHTTVMLLTSTTFTHTDAPSFRTYAHALPSHTSLTCFCHISVIVLLLFFLV